MSSRNAAFVLIVPITLALAACDGGGGGTGPEPQASGPQTVRVLAGGAQTDTVQAVLPQPLTVEVRDAANQPVAGVSVLLASLPVDGGRAGVRLVPDPPAEPGAQHVARTGADGRVVVRVQLDTIAGRTGVRASVGALADSVFLQVEPGRPVRISIGVPDTTLYPPAAYALQASGLDRYGNPVPVQRTPSARISASGEQVQVSTIGRHYLALQSGSVRDTAWVSAVPRGTLAARHSGFRANSSEQFTDLVTISLDGSGRRVVWGHGTNFYPVPRWHPGGDTLFIFQDMVGASIYKVAEGQTGFGEVATPGVDARWAAVSRDWVYLSASDEYAEGKWSYQVWRVRSDGTDLHRLTPFDSLRYDNHPHVTPDGLRVAFTRAEGAISAPTAVWVRDLATGAETRLGPGTLPRWSPSGDRVAYVDGGALVATNPAGGQRQVLVERTADFSWSPDGAYALVHGAPDNRSIGRFYVVVLATGEVIPLTWSRNKDNYFVMPDWRP